MGRYIRNSGAAVRANYENCLKCGNIAKLNTMTETQKRGEILNNRLQILNQYLASEEGTGKTLEHFFRERKINKKAFVSGLPQSLQSPPAKNYDNVFAYAEAMNKMYFDLFMKHQKETEMSADGVVDADYLANESTQPFAGQQYTADGDGIWDRTSYAADGCGLPPIKPLRSRSKVPNKWREYDQKKAAYDKCRADKKEAKGNKDEKKGLHILNKNNPAFVVARSSFLSVCSLNVFKLAYNLNRIHEKDAKLWHRITVKWYNLGGDVSKLESAISRGKNKRGIFGKKMSATGDFVPDGSYSVAGIDDAAIVGYLTSATAIIAVMKPIIKEFKMKNGESTADPDVSLLPDDTSGPIGDVDRQTSNQEIDSTKVEPDTWWQQNWKTTLIVVFSISALAGVAIVLTKSSSS